MASYCVLWVLRALGYLPLPLLRALGWCLGWLLYGVIVSRRHVVMTNLRWCFPDWTQAQHRRIAQQCFVYFAQAWLDRGWLWHASPARIARRVQLTGALDALQGEQPTVLFAPHFMGLDVGWTALTQGVSRQFCTIYTDQANKVMDEWILQGRQRFGTPRLFGRIDGVKDIIASLRSGGVLYLLPDMNFGPHESLFVPFYGVPAATVPSLPRFARLGKAQVVPVVTRLTSAGYTVEVLPAWKDYPTGDLEADTCAMNQRLEQWINAMPAQYYWVHKRFKDRPPGAGEAPY
ncbi:lipid A biosynthesis acyltransferase [Curvibacter sp. CHRR-16]|uniref:lysophospholipid acyltransferase family protein n=1 Tax=Curvibacter sp. CHRR-16 TaxID=2835872 RepID=UPI001BD9318D|nr:lipid A biosynthesis acyltransferase [Curvibacter sp. CHRR-16]MBT0569464.1 lipid A biosynthesis acyltransferase [Curvibacter sp. CHRR-16]